MRTAAASDSKPPKKRSSEDRSRKKSTRSAKRRRDSSSSSYSSSSDDDDYRRPSRRSARSRSPTRARNSRKPKRKKTSTRRRRDLSISSTSSWSSPVRIVRRRKDRGRGREKAGKSSQRRRYKSTSCSTCSCSRSPSRERYKKRENSKRGRLVSDAQEKDSKREKKGDSRTDDRAKIIKAYEDFPSDSDDGRKERKVNLDEATMEKGVEVAGGAGKDGYSTIVEEMIASQVEKEPARSMDDGCDSVARESHFSDESSMRIKSEVVANTHSSEEADDLELILRQKALENFKKFRGGISANMRIGDHRDEDGQAEQCNEVVKEAKTKPLSLPGGSSTNLSERTPATSQVEIRPSEVRLGSVVNPSPEASCVLKPIKDSVDNVDSKSKTANNQLITRWTVACNSQTQMKGAHESTVEVSLEQTSLPRDTNANMPAGVPQSSNIVGAQASKNSPSNSGAVASKTEDGLKEADQFEKKTFSRMHDGEVVQVSYKVYIPKRTPALARRQLQQ